MPANKRHIVREPKDYINLSPTRFFLMFFDLFLYSSGLLDTILTVTYCGYMDVSSSAMESFVDELIAKKFAATPLDDATHADIKRELTDRLNQYLTLRTIEMVSAADPTAVGKLSDLIKTNPAPEQVQTFINTYVKEPDVLVAQIFADFRSLYLGAEDSSN